jgi:hypothetical protein
VTCAGAHGRVSENGRLKVRYATAIALFKRERFCLFFSPPSLEAKIPHFRLEADGRFFRLVVSDHSAESSCSLLGLFPGENSELIPNLFSHCELSCRGSLATAKKGEFR